MEGRFVRPENPNAQNVQSIGFAIIIKKVNAEEKEIFLKGIEHFNSREFFEAHEVWEDVWFPDVGESRRFYQGLIQIAAGYHHVQNANKKGALSLLQAGIEKAQPYGEIYCGMRLGEFLEKVKHSVKVIESLTPRDLTTLHPTLAPQIELDKE